jgi:glycine cleavage system regulatory protein
MAEIVLTVIGPDRPGLVEAIAEVVAKHAGNWLEARMAHLAGQFAGILRIEVREQDTDRLKAALAELQAGGLRIVTEAGKDTPRAGVRPMELELLGHDRPGLVMEISRFLASRHVNVEELTTEVYSAPMSGGPMFRAWARIHVPAGVDEHDLRRGVERLASDLMVEIRLADSD